MYTVHYFLYYSMASWYLHFLQPLLFYLLLLLIYKERNKARGEQYTTEYEYSSLVHLCAGVNGNAGKDSGKLRKIRMSPKDQN